MDRMTRLFDEHDDAQGDRRPIMLVGGCPQSGIAAALRRAFMEPRDNADVEDEFERLLMRLN